MHRELEQLPYYARGACWALQELETARVALSILPTTFPGQIHFGFQEDQLDPIRFAADSFLMNLRRSFDATILYVRDFPSRAARNQIPRSFTELAKGLKKGNGFEIDNQVRALLQSFWESIGERITDYRDLGNHHTIVVSDCLAFTQGNKVFLRLMLPDNPDCKSAAKLTHAPGVPLMLFAANALEQTLKMINAVLNRLVALTWPEATIEPEPPLKPGESRIAIRFTGRGGGFTVGEGAPPPHGEEVPFPLDIKAIAERAVRAALPES